jgi:phage repressor protein C with HTH and peptisase S24 domain
MQEVKSYAQEKSASDIVRGMDPVRALIDQIVTDRKLKLAALSKEIGQNHAYMQQFMKRGVPAKLPEDVRAKLAEALGIDEVALGAAVQGRPEKARGDFLDIPIHDVRASAGHGAMIDIESEIGRWPFPLAYLRGALSLRSRELSLIQVIGDSMRPTLESGDTILVDLGDQAIEQGGVFAIYDGLVTVVKRIEKVPGSDPVEVILLSDNPLHNDYRVLADIVHVAGRVVWVGRKM